MKQIDIKQLLLEHYNEGLKHGADIANESFLTDLRYNTLIAEKQNQVDESDHSLFRKKWIVIAFKEGLQDGYHWNGQSSFEEWFRMEFKNRKS